MLRRTMVGGLVGAAIAMSAGQARAEDKDITLGFAAAFSGWEEAYDGEAVKMAKLWIEQTNAKGGLLGRKIKSIQADTKTDRAEGAKAGQAMVQGGSDLIFVTADYDYGSPAALQAQKAGIVSVFLAASDPKAGVLGVGPYSFTSTDAGQTEGATIADWGVKTKGLKKGFVLLDESIQYDKSVCAGYDWQMPKSGGEVVARDSFKNADPSVSSQVTRLANEIRDHGVDHVMLCSFTPGGASAVKQIRAAGITVPILNGSGMDGTYWLGSVPDLKDFYVPVQAAVKDDPNPAVNELTAAYAQMYGKPPTTQYAYPIYSFLQLWARAVTEAKTTEAAKVVEVMNKFHDEPTLLGPRTFAPKLHIQTDIPLVIMGYADGKETVVGQQRIGENIPDQVLYRTK